MKFRNEVYSKWGRLGAGKVLSREREGFKFNFNFNFNFKVKTVGCHSYRP